MSLADGEDEFGYEPSGRYGGIGVGTGSYIKVPCLDAVRILDEIVHDHGSIDVLKIDIESLEAEILQAIPVRLLVKITKIFVENSFRINPLERTHSYIQNGSVARFLIKPQ